MLPFLMGLDKSYHGVLVAVVDSMMVADDSVESVVVVELTVEVVHVMEEHELEHAVIEHEQEVHVLDTEVMIDCSVVVVENV